MPSADDADPAAWRKDAAAAHAEAVRRINALIAEGGDTLDLSDLPALEALPRELAGAHTLRRLFAGDRNAQGKLIVGSYSLADIDILRALPGLHELGLSDTKITNPPDLTGLTALTSLDLRGTHITTPPALTGLTALTSLDLRHTKIDDLSFLLTLPRFAAEQGERLVIGDTPAADPARDRRLYMLSRLDPKRCAVETVQYLKGTHPDFRDSPGGIRRAPLAQQLAEASPVGLDAPEDRAEAGNPGKAERVHPQEREQRLRALRSHVAALQEEGARRNLPLDIRARFDRYAAPLAEPDPGFVMLDGPMSFLRGGVNDPFVTEGLDGGFVEGWRVLVEMHDALRPFLQPPEDAVPEVAPLTDAATPEDADAVGAAVAETLRAAEAEGAVAASVVAAADAMRDYFVAAKANEAQRATYLRRGLIALGGLVALLTGTGRLAEASIHFQTWLTTPKARWLAERLRPAWERIKSFFETEDDG